MNEISGSVVRDVCFMFEFNVFIDLGFRGGVTVVPFGCVLVRSGFLPVDCFGWVVCFIHGYFVCDRCLAFWGVNWCILMSSIVILI